MLPPKNESAPDSIESWGARSNSPPPKSAQSQTTSVLVAEEWLERASGVRQRGDYGRAIDPAALRGDDRADTWNRIHILLKHCHKVTSARRDLPRCHLAIRR